MLDGPSGQARHTVCPDLESSQIQIFFKYKNDVYLVKIDCKSDLLPKN